MKRFLVLAAMMLGLASCQTEPEGLNVNVGGEVDTFVTVTIPETETRANSADGAIQNLVASPVYTIRYVFEVYYGEGVNQKAVQKQVLYSDGKSVSFPVRLVPGRDYNFVAWADIATQPEDAKMNKALAYEDNTTDVYYDTSDLEAIEIIDAKWNAMNEARDAYTGFYNTASDGDNNKYTGTSSINIQMTRPFAKLRVITTDMVELTNLGITPTSATVKYNTNTNHYQSFNAVAGKVVDTPKTIVEKTHTFNYANVTAYESTDANKVLFTDYFFATKDQEVINFSLDVRDQGGNPIGETINFNTPIPARRNYLTTITGDILTDGNNIKVEVENDGKFEGEIEEKIVEVGNATDLQEAINEADEDTTIVLGGDIDLGDLFGASILSTRAAATLPIVIAEDKVVVLDLNGHKITTPFVEDSTTNHAYAFKNHGSLTIQDSKGNGEIIARGIFNYGTMTLKSGIINACDANGGYGVRNYDGAMFIMEGGSIVTSNEDGDAPEMGKYDATTIRVDEGATATINGGVVNNVSNYTFAIDNYGEVTVNDGTFTSIHSTVSSYGTMTINGGSFIRNGLDGVSGHALIVWNGSNTTINGGTFGGQVINNGYNVYADEGAVVEINGGNFLKAYIASLYGAGTINVKGGTFFDDPSVRVVKGYVAEKNGDVFVVSKIALAENFADNSWDKIILACQNNIVPESWKVGNNKTMTIGDKEYAIRIIGKNHDTYTAGGKAPLTFQIAEVCGSAAMNATQTNTTGWSGSQMRTVTMPEILAAMPVKDAIKAVNKETLNGTRDGLETTSDKLFLLSEIEVNGSEYFSNGFAEGSRYAIYSDLDSQIMNASYWLRGPGKDNAIGFTQINRSGYMANGSAETAVGVVFGFCF